MHNQINCKSKSFDFQVHLNCYIWLHFITIEHGEKYCKVISLQLIKIKEKNPLKKNNFNKIYQCKFTLIHCHKIFVPSLNLASIFNKSL